MAIKIDTLDVVLHCSTITEQNVAAGLVKVHLPNAEVSKASSATIGCDKRYVQVKAYDVSMDGWAEFTAALERLCIQ